MPARRGRAPSYIACVVDDSRLSVWAPRCVLRVCVLSRRRMCQTREAPCRAAAEAGGPRLAPPRGLGPCKKYCESVTAYTQPRNTLSYPQTATATLGRRLDAFFTPRPRRECSAQRGRSFRIFTLLSTYLNGANDQRGRRASAHTLRLSSEIAVGTSLSSSSALMLHTSLLRARVMRNLSPMEAAPNISGKRGWRNKPKLPQARGVGGEW